MEEENKIIHRERGRESIEDRKREVKIKYKGKLKVIMMFVNIVGLVLGNEEV